MRLITILLTMFTSILIPTYWYYYGPQNFLWLSDIGLFLTVLALWHRSLLLMSMAANLFIIELAWNIDFFGKLIFNIITISLADYMFNSSYPPLLRALSLFHIVLPIIWLSYLKKYGYDQQALYYITGLYWIILPITFFYTDPTKNINWVFLPQACVIATISPTAWVIFLALFFPLLFFLPAHFFYKTFFATPKYRENR